MNTQRLKRDIQFEMAMFEIQAMKKRHERESKTKEVVEGIDKFNTNLVRIGIGGSLSIDGGKLNKAMGEDSTAFMTRLQKTFEKDFESKEAEAIYSDLKERVASNRNARQEKIKRKNASKDTMMS
jgi:hypothetical protein